MVLIDPVTPLPVALAVLWVGTTLWQRVCGKQRVEGVAERTAICGRFPSGFR